MSDPWHGLYRVLNTLNVDELRAIRRRCDWCTAYPPEKAKTNFAKRIRDSARDDYKAGEISFDEVVKDIHDSIRLGPRQPTTRIRHVLEDTWIAGDVEPKEENTSRQLYGALRHEFGEDYRVYREHSVNGYRSKFDLFIENTANNKCYLIESKMAKNLDKNNVIGQIVKYNRLIDNKTDLDRRKTFLLVFENLDDEYWYEKQNNPEVAIRNHTEFSESLKEDVEEETRTEVVERFLEEDLF